jgi:pimeloyl-ACP methyl ester carboxylesterase
MVFRQRRQIRYLAWGVGILAIWLAAWPLGAGAQALAGQAAPTVEAVPCSEFQGLSVGGVAAQCGYLSVPENRAKPQSRTIKVAYAIVKTTGPQAQPDPVVFVPGGPGATSINSLADWAALPLVEHRDLILIDPRGTGYSQPVMDCPPMSLPDAAGQAQAPGPAETVAQQVTWAQACRDQLVKEGFDLTTYNTAAIAADLNELRQALGYAQWNLYGQSYGTRTALATLGAYPQGIRSVVLDAVLPPQVDRIGHGDLTSVSGSLAALFAACQADPACSHDYPNLEIQFNEIVARLDQAPLKVTVPDGNTGKTKQVWISGATVVDGVQGAMRFPWLIQVMPLALSRIHAGDQAVIEQLYENLSSSDNQAVYYLALCHDVGALFNADAFHAEVAQHPVLASYYAGDPQATLCGVFGTGQADAAEMQPVRSDIPALLLTGGDFDAATPPAYARLAASSLSHAYVFEFPALSHAVSFNDCPKAMVAGFLDNPTRAPDAACLPDEKGLPFVTDVYLNRGASKLFAAATLQNTTDTVELGVLGLVALITLVMLPVFFIITRRRNKPASLAQAARWLLWLVTLLNVGFAAGAYALAKKALADNYGWVTLFGFSPKASGYLFILPWMAAALTAALLILGALGWRNRWWSLAERIIYTLGTLGAAAFVGLLAYWQVLSF